MKKIYTPALVVLLFFFANPVFSQINTFPYTQDFETFAQCGGSCTSTCALQDGWVNAPTATRDFSSDVGGTSSSGTGPSVDHNPGTSGGRYLYAETSSPCYTGANSWHLLSPTIDLSGTNQVQFSFWYHMLGQSMGTAHIDVSDDGGATWTLDIVAPWTDDIDLWQYIEADLGPWTGSSVIVRIRYENPTNFYGDFAIDDVHIYDLLPNDAGISNFVNPSLPTCSFNDSVVVEITNYGTDTLTSATINWEWNAAAQTAFNWTGSLAIGESEDVFIGALAYGNGDQIKAWTSLPNGVVEFSSGAGNDTTEIASIEAGLNGVYTVGGATPDYTTINDAVTAMNTFGVCGPVTFDIRTGTYNEQIQLTEVIGASATNTITFRSEAGHRDSVIISFASTLSTENYTVQFEGADFMRFEQVTIEATGPTFGHVLEYLGGANSNTIWNCRISGGTSTTTSTNRAVIFSDAGDNDNDNVFIGNTIEGGSYGVYWYGTATTSLESGTVFENNELLNNYYYGMRLYYQDAPIVTENHYTSNSTYTGTMFAIYLYYSDNAMEVSYNIVEGTNTGAFYGLYFGQCDGLPTDNSNVFNNMVTTGGIGSTSTCYGIYSTNSGNMNLYGNNVLARGNGSSTRALYATSGGNIKVYNNNFVTSTPGFGVYLASPYSVVEMDHNNIYAPNGNVGYFNTNLLTLSDWQNASGFDANSLNVDPLYHSEIDLHVCNDTLDGAGIAWPSLTVDIDGQPRAATPDIGADEFTPVSAGILGADQSLCAGETIELWTNSPNDTILWSTGDTTQMISVTAPGTYYVDAAGGCGLVSDTIIISASNEVYTDYLVADTLAFCAGDTVTLSSTMMADSYSWSTGDTTATIQVTAGGNYTLDVTDACGSGSEMITIDENDVPIAGFTISPSYLSVLFNNTSTGVGSTYSWDFGDGNTSTEENPTHVYSSLGLYVVTLTVTNGCGTDIYTDTIEFGLGINEEQLAQAVTIYPNPNDGDFTIDLKLTSNTDVEISVITVLGQTMYNRHFGSVPGLSQELIQLNNAKPGVYFIEVRAGETTFSKKIIIE
jgi:hypothetical protein